MADGDAELVRGLWAAVARGDVDGALETFAPDLRWHGAGDPDGGCRDRDEARAFVRQALDDGVTAEALEVRTVGSRVLVVVQAHLPPAWGEQPEPHGELVTVVDGEVVEIVVFPTVADATTSAGGQEDQDGR